MKPTVSLVALLVLVSACGSYPSDEQVRDKVAALCKDWREGHLDAAYERTAPELKKATSLEVWRELLMQREYVSGACLDVARLEVTTRGVATGIGRYLDVEGAFRYERGEEPFDAKFNKCGQAWCLLSFRIAEDSKPPDVDALKLQSSDLAEKFARGDKEGVWARFSPTEQKSGDKDRVSSHIDKLVGKCADSMLAVPTVEEKHDKNMGSVRRFRTIHILMCPETPQQLRLDWQWLMGAWVFTGYDYSPASAP
jgi:hypothetical protein